MNIRRILMISFVFVLFGLIFNVNASSINYNLRIDNNLHFYETITYNIDNKDVKRDGYYNFLTSVVNDTIYFDLNEEIPYKKSKRKTSNGYIVTLKNDYGSVFLSKSRILKECFVNSDFSNDGYKIRFEASEFYCTHRADNINVSINTGLKVTNSNAPVKSGNTYSWNNVNSDFEMTFVAEVPELSDDKAPMESNYSDLDSNSNPEESDANTDNEDENFSKEKSETKKSSNLMLNIVIIVSSILFIGLISYLYFKAKTKKANEL